MNPIEPMLQRLVRSFILPSTWLSLLPVAMSFICAAVWISWSDNTDSSVALFLGVIAGGLVDMDNRLSGRLKQMLVVLPSFALVSFVVQVAMTHSALLVVLMSALAFAMTMLGAVDMRYRTVSFGVLVVALYTLLSARANLAWYINPVMICIGALLFHVMALLVHLVAPHRPVQMRLVAAYRALGEYSKIKSVLFQPDEVGNIESIQERLAQQNQQVIDTFNQCRDALFSRVGARGSLPIRTQRQLRDYFIAQDIHERLTSMHVDYLSLTEQLRHSDVIFRLARLVRLQGEACMLRADSLDKEERFIYPERLRRAMNGIKSAPLILTRKDLTPLLQRLMDNLEEINRQLARLGKIWRPDAAVGMDWRIAPQSSLNMQQAWHVLMQNITRQSLFFRHAVRMALLTAISVMIVEILDLHLGYWILLTAVFVCQPNYSATQSRLIQRIVGTVLGVIIGSLIPLIEPSLNTSLVIIVISNILFFYFRACDYRYSTIFITVQVLVGFAIIGINTGEAIVPRVVDTLIGAVLSWLCVSFVWPDWRYQSLLGRTRTALVSAATYLAIIGEQLGHTAQDDITYRQVRRRLHEQSTALTAIVNEQRQHPSRHSSSNNSQNGALLVQLHYRLLGYLSSLGAYRGQITQWSAASYDADREAFSLLEAEIIHLANFSANEHAANWIEQFNTLNQKQHDSILAEQLRAIATLLVQYRHLLQQLS